jgi:hypothetical protein
MSRGLGFLERKIVNMLRYGRREYWPHNTLDADYIAERAYPKEADSGAADRTQHTAVLRAMRSVARKYPDQFVLRGGKGRARLVIMVVKAAPEWDEEHPSRQPRRVTKSSAATAAAIPLEVLNLIGELEEHLAQAHKRIAEHREHIENAHKRIAERDEYIERLHQRLEESGQKLKQLSANFQKLEAERAKRRGEGRLTRRHREKR